MSGRQDLGTGVQPRYADAIMMFERGSEFIWKNRRKKGQQLTAGFRQNRIFRMVHLKCSVPITRERSEKILIWNWLVFTEIMENPGAR